MSTAPKSYQGNHVGDAPGGERTYSQTPSSNLPDSTGQVTVGDILSDKGGTVHTLGPEETVKTAVSRLREHRIGVLVVAEGDEMQGIVSERDIVRNLDTEGAGLLSCPIRDLMTASPQTCSGSDPLLSIMHRMTEGKFRHMPVTDGARLVGLISIGDVVKHRLRELEYESLRMKQMIVG